jgi:hypothetical protein
MCKTLGSIPNNTHKRKVSFGVHTCNPSTQRQSQDLEVKASLGYRIVRVSKTKTNKQKPFLPVQTKTGEIKRGGGTVPQTWDPFIWDCLLPCLCR